MAAAQKYLPYGEVRWVTGTLPTDLTYTGQRSENGLGLMDYRARMYSPRLGRFVSADSIVPGAGGAAQNRYMYVEGNPLKYVDSSGHCAGLTGMAFSVCKATVMIAAMVINKANEYREDIFFPDENTTFGERLEASTIVGGGSVVFAVAVTEVFAGTLTTAAMTGGAAQTATTAGTVGTALCKDGDCTNEIETAVSVLDKLQRYLLNPDHPNGSSKAKWFEQALGYTRDNMQRLADQILFDRSTAFLTEVTEYGTKYNQWITITGANGKEIDVLYVWIENLDGIIRLVTAIPTKQ